jgi:YaiO family outer membrane protein
VTSAPLLALLAWGARPDSAVARLWYAGVRYGVESVRGPSPRWQSWAITGGVRGVRASLLADALAITRFGSTDFAVAADGYLRFHPGTYGNLRVQLAADARILPEWDVAAELFHAPARGWEASGGYRRMAFANETVGIFSGGLARYVGSWYLRLRVTAAPHTGGVSPGGSVVLRRFTGDRDGFLELAGGYGSELVTLGPGSVVRRTSRSVLARWQLLVGPSWGMSLGGSLAADQGQPRRAGVALGAFTRW